MLMLSRRQAAALSVCSMCSMCSMWAMAAVAVALPVAAPAAAAGRVRLAVLGDSNSQAYLASGSALADWQWTQLLARWRGGQLDMGEWGAWGRDPGLLVRAAEWLGRPVRTPRKSDYAYNFAIAAQGCDSLLGGPVRQALHLRDLIESDPARWAGALVVVHIGAMELAAPQWLAAAARDAEDAAVVETVRRCQQALTRTVALLERAQPALRLVLVGAFNEAHDPTNWPRWHDPAALARIERALDPFDQHLRLLAAQAPQRRVFVDQRAWFARHWGGRDAASGEPAYRTQALGPLRLAPDAGPGPTHTLKPDLHFGTAANALWAQELVAAMRRQWPQLGLVPIGAAELDPLWLSLQSAASAPAGH